MKVKSIGSNKTEIELRDLLILISYETPVAAIRFEGKLNLRRDRSGAIRTEEYFSNTTSKHINTWLRDHGYEPSKVGTMDQKWFNQLLEDNNQGRVLFYSPGENDK